MLSGQVHNGRDVVRGHIPHDEAVVAPPTDHTGPLRPQTAVLRNLPTKEIRGPAAAYSYDAALAADVHDSQQRKRQQRGGSPFCSSSASLSALTVRGRFGLHEASLGADWYRDGGYGKYNEGTHCCTSAVGGDGGGGGGIHSVGGGGEGDKDNDDDTCDVEGIAIDTDAGGYEEVMVPRTPAEADAYGDVAADDRFDEEGGFWEELRGGLLLSNVLRSSRRCFKGFSRAFSRPLRYAHCCITRGVCFLCCWCCFSGRAVLMGEIIHGNCRSTFLYASIILLTILWLFEEYASFVIPFVPDDLFTSSSATSTASSSSEFTAFLVAFGYFFPLLILFTTVSGSGVVPWLIGVVGASLTVCCASLRLVSLKNDDSSPTPSPDNVTTHPSNFSVLNDDGGANNNTTTTGDDFFVGSSSAESAGWFRVLFTQLCFCLAVLQAAYVLFIGLLMLGKFGRCCYADFFQSIVGSLDGEDVAVERFLYTRRLVNWRPPLSASHWRAQTTRRGEDPSRYNRFSFPKRLLNFVVDPVSEFLQLPRTLDWSMSPQSPDRDTKASNSIPTPYAVGMAVIYLFILTVLTGLFTFLSDSKDDLGDLLRKITHELFPLHIEEAIVDAVMGYYDVFVGLYITFFGLALLSIMFLQVSAVADNVRNVRKGGCNAVPMGSEHNSSSAVSDFLRRERVRQQQLSPPHLMLDGISTMTFTFILFAIGCGCILPIIVVLLIVGFSARETLWWLLTELYETSFFQMALRSLYVSIFQLVFFSRFLMDGHNVRHPRLFSWLTPLLLVSKLALSLIRTVGAFFGAIAAIPAIFVMPFTHVHSPLFKPLMSIIFLHEDSNNSLKSTMTGYFLAKRQMRRVVHLASVSGSCSSVSASPVSASPDVDGSALAIYYAGGESNQVSLLGREREEQHDQAAAGGGVTCILASHKEEGLYLSSSASPEQSGSSSQAASPSYRIVHVPLDRIVPSSKELYRMDTHMTRLWTLFGAFPHRFPASATPACSAAASSSAYDGCHQYPHHHHHTSSSSSPSCAIISGTSSGAQRPLPKSRRTGGLEGSILEALEAYVTWVVEGKARWSLQRCGEADEGTSYISVDPAVAAIWESGKSLFTPAKDAGRVHSSSVAQKDPIPPPFVAVAIHRNQHERSSLLAADSKGGNDADLSGERSRLSTAVDVCDHSASPPSAANTHGASTASTTNTRRSDKRRYTRRVVEAIMIHYGLLLPADKADKYNSQSRRVGGGSGRCGESNDMVREAGGTDGVPFYSAFSASFSSSCSTSSPYYNHLAAVIQCSVFAASDSTPTRLEHRPQQQQQQQQQPKSANDHRQRFLERRAVVIARLMESAVADYYVLLEAYHRRRMAVRDEEERAKKAWLVHALEHPEEVLVPVAIPYHHNSSSGRVTAIAVCSGNGSWRWHLAMTLLRYPQLRAARKHYLRGHGFTPQQPLPFAPTGI